MRNFVLHNPVKIVFGKGKTDQLKNLIPQGAKVLITYGGGSVQKTGLLDQIKENLAEYQLGEFGGIEPNPRYETVMKAVEMIKRDGYDFVLAVGGGSVIDGTKFICAAAKFPDGQDPWAIVKDQAQVKEALPFGTVLTLPATGSEMNSGAVITRQETKSKLAFGSPLVFPQFSILDPEITFTLPKKQIGNGVVDTFVHVMEQYLTYPVNAKIQDRFAEGILHTIIEEGPKALEDPENYDVRANLMWAATWGLNGLIGVGVPQDWASHRIGHELTALYGVDHGQSLAIVLPSLMNVMKEEKKEKILQYAERIWGLSQGTQDEIIQQAIEKTKAFFETMGVATTLSAYGLKEEVIEQVVAQLLAHDSQKLGENETVTPDKVRQILQGAL